MILIAFAYWFQILFGFFLSLLETENTLLRHLDVLI